MLTLRQVLARSSPIDKLTLVKGIQNSKASFPQVEPLAQLKHAGLS
jgi:hypothetical protein